MKTTQKYKIHPEGCLHLLPDIPANSIDMILTDLPYGITACKWDTIINLKRLWIQYERIIKPNGAIVLTASQPFTSALVMSNPKMFKYDWIWEKSRKTGFPNAKKQPLRTKEDILVFYKKQPTYNPQGLKGCMKMTSTGAAGANQKGNATGKITQTESGKYLQEQTNYPKNLLKVQSVSKTIHPTQKPIALAEYLIKTYTNEGDTVHDSCMGSGWSLHTCKNLNRNYIGFEISDEWEYNYKKILGKE